jgi:hypothetical protein
MVSKMLWAFMRDSLMRSAILQHFHSHGFAKFDAIDAGRQNATGIACTLSAWDKGHAYWRRLQIFARVQCAKANEVRVSTPVRTASGSIESLGSFGQKWAGFTHGIYGKCW